MNLKRASIDPAALRKIRSFVEGVKAVEIGGPMVGYVNDDRVLVITDLTGPGSKGKCLPFNVTVDGEHAKAFCDQAFRESGGTVDYVGDWHCHPSISMRPSEGDRLAMKLMAETPGLVPNPVSLIYSTFLRLFRIYEWRGDRQKLVVIPCSKFRRTQ